MDAIKGRNFLLLKFSYYFHGFSPLELHWNRVCDHINDYIQNGMLFGIHIQFVIYAHCIQCVAKLFFLLPHVIIVEVEAEWNIRLNCPNFHVITIIISNPTYEGIFKQLSQIRLQGLLNSLIAERERSCSFFDFQKMCTIRYIMHF